MKSPQQRIVKYLILVLVIIFIFSIFILPNFKKVKKIHNDLTTEAQILEEKYITGQDLEKSSQDYDELENKLPDFDTLFISEGNELSLITKLEQIADNHNLTQELSLALEKKVLSPELKKVSFNFTLSGTFINFLNYLTELSAMNYNLTVQNLNIRQAKEDHMEISLMGYSYWYTPI